MTDSDKTQPLVAGAPPGWRHYLLQSVAFAATILAILLVLELTHQVVIASVGASAFIVFAMPQAPAASPRNILLGQGLGVVVGVLCSLLPMPPVPLDVLNYALAVGLSFFLLTTAKINHPPAVATAFGVAMTGISLELAVILTACLLFLALISMRFGRRLRPLL